MGVNGMQSSVSIMHVATDSTVAHLFLEFRRISERFGRLKLFFRGATILFGFVLVGAFVHAVSMDVESTKGDVERKRRVPRSAPTERPRASNLSHANHLFDTEALKAGSSTSNHECH